MAINSKRKGSNGERELANAIKKHGYECRRSVQYNGYDPEGKPDVIGLPGIHIECKRVEKLNIDTAYDQAVRDCKAGDLPAVFHRKNRRPWLVTMSMEDFVRIYKVWERDEEK